MNNEFPFSSIDRTAFSIVSLDDDSDEVEYWLLRTPQERLNHIQRLRYINYGDQASGRLQRVLTVVELTSS